MSNQIPHVVTYTNRKEHVPDEVGKYFIKSIKDAGAVVYNVDTRDNSQKFVGLFNARDFGETFISTGWERLAIA